MLRAPSALLVSFSLLLVGPAWAQNKLEWVRDLDVALEQAAEQDKLIFVSIGMVGELRSEEIRKRVLADKALALQAALTLNVPAWTWAIDEEKKLADFGDAEALDHTANLARVTTDWVEVNDQDVFALPQHLWLNAKGELLLSVPWELDAAEMSWCFDEAMRLAGKDERPPIHGEARAPRRLLYGETVRVMGEDDIGRGLTDEELEQTMSRLKRGFVTARDRLDIARVMFTPKEEAAEFLNQQFGLWDFGGAAASGLFDFLYEMVGLIAPPEHLGLLEEEVESTRASLRAVIAVCYEQIGHPEGLKAVKKALKKEKDDAVRAEWVRALGACAPRDKAVAKQLIKLAEKDEDARVSLNAVLALGHVLPQADAREWLLEQALTGKAERQRAAVLALAIGREQSVREALEGLRQDAGEGPLSATMDLALGVLKGAGLAALEAEVRALDGSPYPRPRLFYRAVFELPEGGGRGTGREEGR